LTLSWRDSHRASLWYYIWIQELRKY